MYRKQDRASKTNKITQTKLETKESNSLLKTSIRTKSAIEKNINKHIMN